jgi:hypothetical protein
MAVNITELVTTTLRNRDRMVADNVTNHNGLLRTMEDTGRIKNAGGGRDLTEPLLYNELATKFYDGFETFTIDTSQEVIDAAVYQWKQLGGFSFISGKEKIMNREKWQAVSIAESRIDALIAGLRNKTGLSLYSLGTGDGGKEFGGLRLLVADAPGTGVVGGIDGAVETWWQNQFADLGADWAATNVLSAMNAMQLACTRGADQPDLIMASANPFTAYWESLQANARHTSPKLADAGFRTLEFIGTPVVYDAQCATDLTNPGAGRMYFLNTKYLCFRKAPERFFTTEDSRKVENADYDVIPNWTMGNLTTNARFLQGVIFDTGTP